MLRIKRLSVRGLGPIERLDLPEDGLGWGDEIPRMVLLGGPNGGGKTTLLNFIEAAMRTLADDDHPAVPTLVRRAGEDASLEMEVSDGHDGARGLRFGLSANLPRDGRQFGVCIEGTDRAKLAAQYLPPWLTDARHPYAESLWPGVLHFPSEDRSLIVMPHRVEPAGAVYRRDRFVYRWEKPSGWQDTLQSALQHARWQDFNRGTADGPASLFSLYATEFKWFSGGSKELVYNRDGELVVRLADGSEHGLDALSSGEKQVILLTCEIRWRMRPGSLVLLDEPELHLHPVWQTKLYERLVRLAEEEAGQIIMATQSTHLFRTAEPGTAALIGTGAF